MPRPRSISWTRKLSSAAPAPGAPSTASNTARRQGVIRVPSCGPAFWRTRLQGPAFWRTRLRLVAAFARTRVQSTTSIVDLVLLRLVAEHFQDAGVETALGLLLGLLLLDILVALLIQIDRLGVQFLAGFVEFEQERFLLLEVQLLQLVGELLLLQSLELDLALLDLVEQVVGRCLAALGLEGRPVSRGPGRRRPQVRRLAPLGLAVLAIPLRAEDQRRPRQLGVDLTEPFVEGGGNDGGDVAVLSDLDVGAL